MSNYDEGYEHPVTEARLRDGTDAWVWPLLPTDREALAREFETLSEESRRKRFLAPVMHLTDAMLTQLVDEVDGVNHVALVMFAEDGDAYVPVAIGRIVRYPDLPDAADLAVTVKDSWQGRGVASSLLPVLMRQRPPGVTRILTEVSSDNPASLKMLEHLGRLTLHTNGSGGYDVEIDLTLGPEQGPVVPVVEPKPGWRLHPVLREADRAMLRVRDEVCPWLHSPDA